MLVDWKEIYGTKMNYEVHTKNSVYTLTATALPNVYKISGGILDGVREIRLMNDRLYPGVPMNAVFTSNHKLNGLDSGELFKSSTITKVLESEVVLPQHKDFMVSTKNSDYLIKETNTPNEYLISGGRMHGERRAYILPNSLETGKQMVVALDGGELLTTSPIERIHEIGNDEVLTTLPEMEMPEFE